jgi:glycine oxidase
MHDVIVIGGGVIGLSTAFRLAGEGISCAVLDQGPLGQESSWAGAGMLPPGNPEKARTAEARLRAASHQLWPDISDQLRELTRVDNGFRRCGGLELRLDGPASELDHEIAVWQQEGVRVRSLTAPELALAEPGITSRITAGYALPEMGQVRNPRHIKALIAGCSARGVTLKPGAPVWELHTDRGRVSAISTPEGRLSAGQFIVAGGAWSGQLLAQVDCRVPLRPMRGQIVLLSTTRSIVRQVINVGPRYLVPRGDGRILVGATQEVAGFDKQTTAAGAGGLLQFALGLFPDLADAAIERTWAGLRPQSADGLPYLGKVPGVEGLFVAAGHFRAGLQLSPVTAHLMCDLIMGKTPSLPMEEYAVDRHSGDTPFAVEGDR